MLTALILSASAFAAGNRLPVNTPGAHVVKDGDRYEVTVDWTNDGDAQVCDTYASLVAYRNGDQNDDSITVTAWLKGHEVKSGREVSITFNFDDAEFGRGFIPDLTSQQYNASCVDAGSATSPSQACNPQVQDCNQTCQASLFDPTRCASDVESWSADRTKFL